MQDYDSASLSVVMRPPAGVRPRREITMSSGSDRVASVAHRSFSGLDLEAPFLLQAGAEEAAYAVGLPLGDGHELFQRGAARPFQQFQNLGCLGTCALCAGLLRPAGTFTRLALPPGSHPGGAHLERQQRTGHRSLDS